MDEREIRRDEAERWWQLERDATAAVREFSTATIRSLILINGGAVIALLSFLASGSSPISLKDPRIAAEIVYSLASYGGGLFLAVLAGGIGYLNFSSIAAGLPGPGNLAKYVESGVVEGWSDWSQTTVWTARIGFGSALLSGLLFLLGAYLSLSVLLGLAS